MPRNLLLGAGVVLRHRLKCTRSFVLALTVLSLGVSRPTWAAGPAERSPSGVGIEALATTRVAGAAGHLLAFPVFATHAPGDYQRLFIVEKQGRIRILSIHTGALQTVAGAFLNIDAIVTGGTTLNSEQGLLGLTFHPDYQTNGFFYVNYTGTSGAGDTFIARYTVSANPEAANAASGVTILTFDQPQANHNGGWIDFGPLDGYLYIATGDGGNFCDTGAGHTAGTGNAQDTTTNRLGKILRLDVDAGSPYGIPAGNPFVGISGDDEIWLYGLRNPWRDSFDRVTGDLYIGDVGQDAREEVDYKGASSTGGQNYGWRCMEGNSCSSLSGCTSTGCLCGIPAVTPCNCNDAAMTDPILDYAHAGAVCAVTGGYVYRGCRIPTLEGTYFYSDFCAGFIKTFRVVDGHAVDLADRTADLTPSIEGFAVNQIGSFGEDALGEMYIVDQGSGADGQIFRIIPEVPTIVPADLNCDGVVDPNDLALLLGQWGQLKSFADLNGDGVVNPSDLALLLGAWG